MKSANKCTSYSSRHRHKFECSRKYSVKLDIRFILLTFISIVDCLRPNVGGKLGSFTVISAKPCQNALGQVGTCMFMWDCIKSEGKHLGTCSDKFLFGSCCYHNSTAHDIDLQRPATSASNAQQYQSNQSESQEHQKDQKNPIHSNNSSQSSHSSIRIPTQSLMLASNTVQNNVSSFSLPNQIGSNYSSSNSDSSTNYQASNNQISYQSFTDSYNGNKSSSVITSDLGAQHQQQQAASASWQQGQQQSGSNNQTSNQIDNQSNKNAATFSVTQTTTASPPQPASPLIQFAQLHNQIGSNYYQIGTRPPFIQPAANRPVANIQSMQEPQSIQQQQQNQRPQSVSWFQKPVSILANTFFHTFRPLNFLHPTKQRPVYRPFPLYMKPGSYRPIITQLGPQRIPTLAQSGAYAAQLADQSNYLDGKNSSTIYNISKDGYTTSVANAAVSSGSGDDGVEGGSSNNKDHHITNATSTDEQYNQNLTNSTDAPNQSSDFQLSKPTVASLELNAHQSIVPSELMFSSSGSSFESRPQSVPKPNVASLAQDNLIHLSSSSPFAFLSSSQMMYSTEAPAQHVSSSFETELTGSQQEHQSQNVSFAAYGSNTSAASSHSNLDLDYPPKYPNKPLPLTAFSDQHSTTAASFHPSSMHPPPTQPVDDNHQQLLGYHTTQTSTNDAMNTHPLILSSAQLSSAAASASMPIHEIQGLSTGPQPFSNNSNVTAMKPFLAGNYSNNAHPDTQIVSLALLSQMTDGNKYPIDDASSTGGNVNINPNCNKPSLQQQQQNANIFQLSHGRPSSFGSTSPSSAAVPHIVGNIDEEGAIQSQASSQASDGQTQVKPGYQPQTQFDYSAIAAAATTTTRTPATSSQHFPASNSTNHKNPIGPTDSEMNGKPSSMLQPPTGVASPLQQSLLQSTTTTALSSAPSPTPLTMTPSYSSKPAVSGLIETSNHHQREVPCGVTSSQPQTKVVGGKNAAFGAWPWQVSVRKATFFGLSSTHRCGGALISSEWIATAGHCVEDLHLSTIRIRVGEYDFGSNSEPYPYIERSARRKVVHPKYNFYTYENDLAVVQLDQPLRFPPHVAPICLPPDDIELLGRNATVTGWGRLNEGGTLPTVLQEVRVPIVSNDKCKNMFLKAGRPEYIPDIFLCAGFEEGGRDSCQGDSGGPLQVKGDDGKWFLAGIISWGIGCAERNLPGVCTRISRFRQWIQATMNLYK